MKRRQSEKLLRQRILCSVVDMICQGKNLDRRRIENGVRKAWRRGQDFVFEGMIYAAPLRDPALDPRASIEDAVAFHMREYGEPYSMALLGVQITRGVKEKLEDGSIVVREY
jgi:hypothetical protein